MGAIVGLIIVVVAVFGGYMLEGGNIKTLWQPIELLIIGGSAFGTLFIGAPGNVLKLMGHQLGGVFKSGGISKEQYLEILACLFELCKTAKANPLSLEPHVEKPEESEIFKRYPGFLHNHHAVHFLCDTLKVQLSSSLNPYDLEALMDADIDIVHKEELAPIAVLSRAGDAMPGLGIVAAVLGVVITMGKLTMGKEVIGHSVAAALVGTFLGILLSYGVFQPLAAKMETNVNIHGTVFTIIKATLIAYAKECSPKVCVEFGRRSIPPEFRPTFSQLDEATSGKKAA